MKKLLLAGIAALLLSTGAAHATERFPEAMLGNWCWVEGGMSKTATSKSLLVYLPRDVTWRQLAM